VQANVNCNGKSDDDYARAEGPKRIRGRKKERFISTREGVGPSMNQGGEAKRCQHFPTDQLISSSVPGGKLIRGRTMRGKGDVLYRKSGLEGTQQHDDISRRKNDWIPKRVK